MEKNKHKNFVFYFLCLKKGEQDSHQPVVASSYDLHPPSAGWKMMI